METSPIIIVLAVLWMVSVASLYLLELGGTSWYDLSQLKKQKHRQAHPYIKQYRYKPLISVIIPSHNDEAVIEKCLDAILKSSYRKLEIVIINDASSDDTKRLVKDYAQAHPKQTIHSINKRKLVGRTAAIKAGLGKSHGELIMVLNATDTIDKEAFKNAVQQFAQEDIGLIIPNSMSRNYPSVISLLERFEQVSTGQLQKLGLSVNSPYISGGSGAIYKKEVLKGLKDFTGIVWTNDKALSRATSKLASKQLSAYYANNVMITAQPTTSYKSLVKQHYRQAAGNLQTIFTDDHIFSLISPPKLFTRFRLFFITWSTLTTLLEPIIMAYFIYLAVSFNQPLFYLISWGTLTFLMWLAVWKNEQLTRNRKILLTAYLPIMYNLVWLLRFIEILAVLIYSAISTLRIFSGRYKARPLKAKQAGSRA